MLIQYQKTHDDYTEYTLGNVQELATLDGVTYCWADGEIENYANLPYQEVTLTPELRNAIKEASPQCRCIGQRVDEMVRERYTQEQENYYTRITVGQMAGMYVMEPGEMEEVQAFGEYVEQCRQWGRNRRAEIGL